MTAAFRTCPIALTDSITCGEKTTLCFQANLLLGSEIVMVSKLCGSNPGSTSTVGRHFSPSAPCRSEERSSLRPLRPPGHRQYDFAPGSQPVPQPLSFRPGCPSTTAPPARYQS